MSSAPSHAIDLDVSQLVLDVTNKKVRGLDQHIDNSLTDGRIERTMDGASSLTLVLNDARRALLRSGIFDNAIEVSLDALRWRLVKVSKQDDELTLVFEDREVALLRRYTGPKKANRANVTRAEFALSLVREVKEEDIEFICPDLHVKQKVLLPKKKKTRATTDTGINKDAQLTVKKAPASAAQKRMMEQVLDCAAALGAELRVQLALVEACIVESQFANLDHGDRDSKGVLQVRSSTAAGMSPPIDNMDVNACVNAFLTKGFYSGTSLGGGGAIAIAARHPNAMPGPIAQATQGSGTPNAYAQWESEAELIVQAYKPSAGAGGDGTVTRLLPYQFMRGGTDPNNANSWDCLQNLAHQVNWRCFMNQGALYFISDDDLIAAKPRLILSESDEGVLGLDFDIDQGKKVEEVRLTARASRWTAAPGSVVVLNDDTGPARGRWLVWTIERDLFDATATITLHRKAKAYLEPANQTRQGRKQSGAQDKADIAYQAAQDIDKQHLPYVYGGGHAACGTPDRGGNASGPVGYDCSAAVDAVLAYAGMDLQLGARAPDSGGLMAWGESGKGRKLTVYTRPNMRNRVGHAFIVFHSSTGDQHFGTGDWGKGWGGAGFNPHMHPLDASQDLTARHWPGL